MVAERRKVVRRFCEVECHTTFLLSATRRSNGLSTNQLLDEWWHKYLGDLHGEVVQARSMKFVVLTDRDVLTICKK